MLVQVEPRDRGKRLDAFLQTRLKEYSRSRLQGWIRDGLVRVDDRAEKPSFVLRGSERIEVHPAQLTPLRAEAEDIPLNVLYEDEWLVAIDKPAGMVVHAGAGVDSGTVVNALLHRFSQLSTAGGDLRPGIVHRLDRFTSGVLLAAKTDAAHQALSRLFASRQMRKTYLALVHKEMAADAGRIEKPIARDPIHRTRMTARLLSGGMPSGRPAWSEWKVLERFAGFSFLEVLIGTGRTHQIRVHLQTIGHPVVGDRLYGAPAGSPEMPAGMPDLKRYFLHAHRIAFHHPFLDTDLAVTAPLASELALWLNLLRDRKSVP